MKKKKLGIQVVFESGSNSKPLRLMFTFDPLTGTIVNISRTKETPTGAVLSHKITRREYYAWGKKFIPKRKMTEEERRLAHIESVKRHRKKAKVYA